MPALSLNIDHIATLRNARGEAHPCPVRGAKVAMESGVDGITAHLREDRRHIRDEDIFRLRHEIPLPLNLEMAATEEMQRIALQVKPHAICLVPEKRAELTTEGGLDVVKQETFLKEYLAPLNAAGIHTYLFIDPVESQLQASARTGAKGVELHTGPYAVASAKRLADAEAFKRELSFLYFTAEGAGALGLDVHAGHGLTFDNVGEVAALPGITEISIGHFMIGEAVFLGLPETVRRMRAAMRAFAK